MTGDEPMTAGQRSYLETLCRETREEFDETLSKANASKWIHELRDPSGRFKQSDDLVGSAHLLKIGIAGQDEEHTSLPAVHRRPLL